MTREQDLYHDRRRTRTDPACSFAKRDVMGRCGTPNLRRRRCLDYCYFAQFHPLPRYTGGLSTERLPERRAVQNGDRQEFIRASPFPCHLQ
ncbi:MAG TPA: hypothetical protein PLQ35_00360 [bacterium]|nr:hypothetical protein [bacterium]HQL60721.1 hypothetical protein [bacterium]